MITDGSRYDNTKVYKFGDKYHFGIRDILKKKDFDDNILHTVSQNDRIENIANLYWNRPDLWYIICDWNDIFDPIDELEFGKTLILPSYKRILEGAL